MSNQESVPVFPAGMPAGLIFAHDAARLGRRVIGASSLAHDPERGHYPEWTSLPWVLDRTFAQELADRIEHFNIQEIFTPHPVVWDQINRLLPSLPAQPRLCPQPGDADLASYKRQRALAIELLARSGQWIHSANPRPPLTVAQTAGLIRLFELTPGQCSHDKLEAVISLFRDLPPGDIVEIGCLYGRSALAFAFLARHYRIGMLLCVDPWSPDEVVQDSKELDELSKTAPLQAFFEAFTANLAPWRDITNYLRLPSVAGAEAYAASKTVTSPEFGATHYSGEIAILHIDGNHAHHAVSADTRAWTGFVKPGGWIIFDDYRWPFGDGPRLVADEFCERFRNHWSLAFEAAGALFVRLDAALGR